MTIEQMKSLDVRTVDPATLVDRKTVKIDSRLPREKRVSQYLSQIVNPYCYMDDGVVVKVSFTPCRETINDRLLGCARSM
jgi:RecJ-like exonuclease